MSGTYSYDEGVSKKENRNKTIQHDSTPKANRVIPSTEKATVINTPKIDDNRRVQYTGKAQTKKAKEWG